MFAVYRDHLRTATAQGAQDERSGRDERLLVRESEALAVLECRQSRFEASYTDDRIDDDVGIRMRRSFDQPAASGLFDKRNIFRFEPVDLPCKVCSAAMRGECNHMKEIRVSLDHCERAATDRTRASEQCDADAQCRPPPPRVSRRERFGQVADARTSGK